MLGAQVAQTLRLACVVLACMLACACALPSANIGRPVEPGRVAGTASMGQALGSSTFDEYDEEGEDERVHSELPQGLGVPASAVLGLRTGVLTRADLGAELSFLHAGLNTRVAVMGPPRSPRLVWTLDGRMGFIREVERNSGEGAVRRYEVTSRLLGYIPREASGRWDEKSIVFGGGVAWGIFPHIATHGASGNAPFSMDLVHARELRLHGLFGVSRAKRQSGSELVLYVDPYWVIARGEATGLNYRHFGGVVGCLSSTFGLW